MRGGVCAVVVLAASLSLGGTVFGQSNSGPAPVAGQGLRAFALWLEDADVLEKGHAALGVGGGVWSATNGRQWDMAFDVGYGITDWLQVSASVPYYQASYDTGFNASGRGDTYIWGKVQLLNASSHGVGIAALPLLEVLSDAELADPTLGLKRTNWGLPVSLQVGTGKTRVYATGGYFSRGAVFVAGAVEQTITDRFTLSGTLQYTHSLHDLTGTDSASPSGSRVDATIGGSVMFAPNAGAYVSVGRTVSTLDENGAKLIVNFGLTVTVGPKDSPPAK
jgi:hypothetical protein